MNTTESTVERSILCIYHGNCADGFASAWAVRMALGEATVEFYPGVYQRSPPAAVGKKVIFVDFSYKREVMLNLAAQTEGILVLDHHKSAEESLAADGNYIIDLNKYTAALGWRRVLDNFYQDKCEGTPYGRIYTLFDQERSGAMITWDFFFPGVEPPALLKHIQDRDLWKFQLPHTRAIQAGVFSYPYDFAVWDGLMNSAALMDLLIGGTAIERKHFKDIEELVKVCMYWVTIGGYNVPVANLPYTLTSDAGHLMASEFAPHAFAACFWNTKYGRTFSLRSVEGGMDVSKVAEQYGGGGHKNAAGFSVSWDDPLAHA